MLEALLKKYKISATYKNPDEEQVSIDLALRKAADDECMHDMALLLHVHKASIDACSLKKASSGNTAAHILAKKGNAKLLGWLLGMGDGAIDMSRPNREGKTPVERLLNAIGKNGELDQWATLLVDILGITSPESIAALESFDSARPLHFSEGTQEHFLGLLNRMAFQLQIYEVFANLPVKSDVLWPYVQKVMDIIAHLGEPERKQFCFYQYPRTVLEDHWSKSEKDALSLKNKILNDQLPKKYRVSEILVHSMGLGAIDMGAGDIYLPSLPLLNLFLLVDYTASLNVEKLAKLCLGVWFGKAIEAKDIAKAQSQGNALGNPS